MPRDHLLGYAPLATFIADSLPNAPKAQPPVPWPRFTPAEETSRRFKDAAETSCLSICSQAFVEVFCEVEKSGFVVAYSSALEERVSVGGDCFIQADSSTVDGLQRGQVYSVLSAGQRLYSRWEGRWMGRSLHIERALNTRGKARDRIDFVYGLAE